MNTPEYLVGWVVFGWIEFLFFGKREDNNLLLRGNTVNRSKNSKNQNFRKKMCEWYFCHTFVHDIFFCTLLTKPTGGRVQWYALGTPYESWLVWLFNDDGFVLSRLVRHAGGRVEYAALFSYGGRKAVPTSLNKHANDISLKSLEHCRGVYWNSFLEFENPLEICRPEAHPSRRFF